MSDIEHPPIHVILDRSVTVGDSTFRVAATDAGDGFLDVTVLGIASDGRVTSEIGGSITLADLPAVTDALTSTLTALATLCHPPGPRRLRAAEHHPNRGGRWTPSDDERLLRRHREGATDRELMTEFGRSRGGIRLRLERLGAIPTAVA